MPLDEHIEGGHGEREPGVKIGPDPVHDLFAMADEGQHREHRLDEHTVLPRAALTQFEVRGIPFRSMEGRITQTIICSSNCRTSHRKVLSATLAVAHAHPTTNPH